MVRANEEVMVKEAIDGHCELRKFRRGLDFGMFALCLRTNERKWEKMQSRDIE